VALTVAVVLGAAAACGGSSSSSSSSSSTASASAGGHYLWSMVTDQAGLGDKGFNDLAKKGVDDSAAKLGGRAQVIQSSEQAQYVPNLQQSVSNGATVTTGVGFLITDSISQVAQDSPDAKFVLIDSTATNDAGKPLTNVASVNFRANEASFLAGIIAGRTTKTRRIGVVGGIDSDVVTNWISGFQAGLRQVDPSIRLDRAFLGNFTDSAKAKELATGFYDAGADIVFEVAGAGALGVYAAAKTAGAGHWVVSTDTCKESLAPDNFLTSATKDVAGAITRENTAATNGTFKGGEISLGLTDNAVGVCQDNYSTLSADIRGTVESAEKAIRGGALKVPGTAAEVASFTPAKL
jgi:basic membrane protein A